jgi:hypothetical protein
MRTFSIFGHDVWWDKISLVAMRDQQYKISTLTTTVTSIMPRYRWGRRVIERVELSYHCIRDKIMGWPKIEAVLSELECRLSQLMLYRELDLSP